MGYLRKIQRRPFWCWWLFDLFGEARKSYVLFFSQKYMTLFYCGGRCRLLYFDLWLSAEQRPLMYLKIHRRHTVMIWFSSQSHYFLARIQTLWRSTRNFSITSLSIHPVRGHMRVCDLPSDAGMQRNGRHWLGCSQNCKETWTARHPVCTTATLLYIGATCGAHWLLTPSRYEWFSDLLSGGGCHLRSRSLVFVCKQKIFIHRI